MSEIDAVEEGEPSWEDTPLTPERIGAIMGTWDLVLFPIVTHIVFDELLSGLIAGAFVGIGTFLFLPYVLRLNAEDESNPSPVDGGRQRGGFHRGAAGFALSTAGVLLIVWRFVSEEVLLGVAGVLVLAAFEYAILSFVLPRR